MRRSWSIVLLLLSLGINLGLGLAVLRAPAPAGSPPPPDPARSWLRGDPPGPRPAERHLRGRLDRMARELGLDRDQQAALWELHEGVSEQFFAHRGRMVELRGRMRTALTAPAATWDDVQAVQRQQSRLQARLDSLVARIMFEERRILTPDQLARYHEFVFPRHGHERPGGRRGADAPGRGRRHGRSAP